MVKNKKFIYELNYLDMENNFKIKYFYDKISMDNFIFSNEIYIIYIYSFSLHNYIFICDFLELFNLILLDRKGV